MKYEELVARVAEAMKYAKVSRQVGLDAFYYQKGLSKKNRIFCRRRLRQKMVNPGDDK